jgi:hypothetical protein
VLKGHARESRVRRPGSYELINPDNKRVKEPGAELGCQGTKGQETKGQVLRDKDPRAKEPKAKVKGQGIKGQRSRAKEPRDNT